MGLKLVVRVYGSRGEGLLGLWGCPLILCSLWPIGLGLELVIRIYGSRSVWLFSSIRSLSCGCDFIGAAHEQSKSRK
jgi:hypothetical protein